MNLTGSKVRLGFPKPFSRPLRSSCGPDHVRHPVRPSVLLGVRAEPISTAEEAFVDNVALPVWNDSRAPGDDGAPYVDLGLEPM